MTMTAAPASSMKKLMMLTTDYITELIVPTKKLKSMGWKAAASIGVTTSAYVKPTKKPTTVSGMKAVGMNAANMRNM